MDLSRTFDYIFSEGHIEKSADMITEGASFNGGLYKYQIVIPVKERLEIPTFAENNVRDVLTDNFLKGYPPPEEIRILLVPKRSFANKRSADSIFSYIINAGAYRIRVVKTPKGDTYYGNRSMLLNRDMEPLYFAVASYYVDFENMHMLPLDHILYIDPKVFRYQNDLMNKSIIKKLIPTMTLSNDYKFIIKDLSTWIKKDVEPILKDSASTLNNLLQDNLANILEKVA